MLSAVFFLECSVDRRLKKLLPPILILGAMFLFAPAYLNRDLWFDEALTFLDFAQRGSPLVIYRSYVIPNNQILYTIALHYWAQLLPPGIDPVFWFRLLSFFSGIATLLLLYRLFRVRLAGGTILLPVLAAMAVSVPFLIYATALRGYMQSALFVVLALHTALNFAGKPDWKRGFWYALASLGAVATIPSNLAVLAGVVLYALPLFGWGFWKRRAFWILAAIPPAMFLLFYLPIFPSFLGCLRLGEGWNSGWGALLAVLAAFVYSFAMLLLPGTGSLLALDRTGFKWVRAVRLLIWLIPLPMALLLKVAPFPRVFFSVLAAVGAAARRGDSRSYGPELPPAPALESRNLARGAVRGGRRLGVSRAAAESAAHVLAPIRRSGGGRLLLRLLSAPGTHALPDRRRNRRASGETAAGDLHEFSGRSVAAALLFEHFGSRSARLPVRRPARTGEAA